MAEVTLDGQLHEVVLEDGSTLTVAMGQPTTSAGDVVGYLLLPVQDMSDSYMLHMDVGNIGPFEFSSGAGLGSPWLLGQKCDDDEKSTGKRVGVSGTAWMVALANLLLATAGKESVDA